MKGNSQTQMEPYKHSKLKLLLNDGKNYSNTHYSPTQCWNLKEASKFNHLSLLQIKLKVEHQIHDKQHT
jgi:hypothetical protein